MVGHPRITLRIHHLPATGDHDGELLAARLGQGLGAHRHLRKQHTVSEPCNFTLHKQRRYPVCALLRVVDDDLLVVVERVWRVLAVAVKPAA
jgi:hypothetical protein